MDPTQAARPRRLRVAVVAAAAVAALFLSIGPMASAQAGPPYTAQSGIRPTIVLEHGAWADGSSWARVIRLLQRDGYTVTAPPNPLRGLANDTAYLADYLSTITGPVVLVGHSYGGAVITDAATGNRSVKALVYVDAFIPDQGETLLQLVGARPGSCLGGDPTKVFNFVPYPGAPAGDVDLYLRTAADLPYPGFARCFANGLSAREAALLAATQRPLTLSAAMAQSGPPAWKTIPSWSVIGTADHVLPPAEQQFMSKHAKAHITRVDAGHLSLTSNPFAIARVIVAAARATG
jgi:pimeloyl-ACP methyl ester carboxylesterase